MKHGTPIPWMKQLYHPLFDEAEWLCAWRQDHLRPAPQGLPSLFLLIYIFCLSLSDINSDLKCKFDLFAKYAIVWIPHKVQRRCDTRELEKHRPADSVRTARIMTSYWKMYWFIISTFRNKASSFIIAVCIAVYEWHFCVVLSYGLQGEYIRYTISATVTVPPPPPPTVGLKYASNEEHQIFTALGKKLKFLGNKSSSHRLESTRIFTCFWKEPGK